MSMALNTILVIFMVQSIMSVMSTLIMALNTIRVISMNLCIILLIYMVQNIRSDMSINQCIIRLTHMALNINLVITSTTLATSILLFIMSRRIITLVSIFNYYQSSYLHYSNLKANIMMKSIIIIILGMSTRTLALRVQSTMALI